MSTSRTNGVRVPRPYDGVEEKAPDGVIAGQQMADVATDEAVVFVIGMRINRLRKIRSWWPVFVGMPAMLKELEENPEEGLLHARSYFSGRQLMVLQYWRSAEDLGRYAKDMSRAHAPAWAAFNKSAATATGDVGIFHETYVVPRDGIETRYANMPATGLAAAFAALPRSQRKRRTKADDRLGVVDPEYAG
jgi:hypothetical protein